MILFQIDFNISKSYIVIVGILSGEVLYDVFEYCKVVRKLIWVWKNGKDCCILSVVSLICQSIGQFRIFRGIMEEVFRENIFCRFGIDFEREF